MKLSQFLDKTVKGGLIGIVSSLVLFYFLDENINGEIRANALNLVSILVAIFAAYLALLGVRKQIEQQVMAEEKRRLAELSSAKSVLPLALSQIVSIAKGGMELSLTGPSQYRGLERVGEFNAKTELSPDPMQVLRVLH